MMADPALYELLPDALQPPADRRSRGLKNGVQAAIDYVETMKSLPAGLKPRRGIHYSPPRFVYGWMMSDEECCDFLKKNYPQFIGMGMDDDEEYLDVRITLNLVRDHFEKELHIKRKWRPSLDPAVDPRNIEFEALTLTDSYTHGNKLPPRDVIEKYKAFFQLEREPRWFLHGLHYRWRRRIIYRCSNGELEVRTDC